MTKQQSRSDTSSRIRVWRGRVAVLAAGTTALIGALAWGPPPPDVRLKIEAPITDEPSETNWWPLLTEEEQTDGISKIESALTVAMNESESLFRDPELLRVEMLVVLRAAFSGDGAPYYKHSIEQGRTLDRDMAASLAKEWSSWGLLPEYSKSPVPDEQLFEDLWATGAGRHMQIRDMNPKEIQVGRGLVQILGGSGWPHQGIRGQISIFVPPEGRLSQETGEKLATSDESAFIRLGVKWSDGIAGHLRINFFFDGSSWHPLSVAVGSETREQWPTPLL